MYVIGLTGPMGSGKSHVLSILRELGAECLRADDASRELLASDMRLLSEIRRDLGDGVFRSDGSLDRKQTAKLIFRSADARRRLEAIVHPSMVEWLRAKLNAMRAGEDPPRIVIVEAAILTHMGARPLADAVVRVHAPVEECQARIQRRDGISRQQAVERLAAHQELGLFDEPADHVLSTAGDPRDTERRTKALWNTLLAEADQRGS